MGNLISAVVLLSGGLDSLLAARIMQDQGVKISGVHFSTGFCTIQRRRRVARAGQLSGRRFVSDALQTAAALKVPIQVIDVSHSYLDIVLHPKHGYGAQMNPCQDCRTFMLRQAKSHMEEIHADFIITGEVVGQRPNSQKRHLLYQTEKESGLHGLVLRPLSAKILRPTIPEKERWVDREKLYGIAGRGRRTQITLAAHFGITKYAQPAGGCCMLVEEAFSRRLGDFLDHNPPESLNPYEISLLSVGRHLRLPDNTKVIVGRHEGENHFLDRARQPHHWRIEAVGGGSPVALVTGPLSKNQMSLTASIVAGYSKQKSEDFVMVNVDTGDSSEQVTVAPLSQDQLQEMNVGAAP